MWILKNTAKVNITKKKQTHRYREQTSGYQWEEGRGRELGSNRYKLSGIKEATRIHCTARRIQLNFIVTINGV